MCGVVRRGALCVATEELSSRRGELSGWLSAASGLTSRCWTVRSGRLLAGAERSCARSLHDFMVVLATQTHEEGINPARAARSSAMINGFAFAGTCTRAIQPSTTPLQNVEGPL